jgi:alkylation response protein AidB-like acyl-CoA dehydrogenase
MDIEPSVEQTILKDTVDRLMAERYPFEARKRYGDSEQGWSADLWTQYAELGLLGLPFHERYGGSGRGPVETMILFEAFGRALVLEPYFATVVLAGGLIRVAGTEEQKMALLPRLVGGGLKLAFAHGERDGGGASGAPATEARRVQNGWVVSGAKNLVLHGGAADTLIVSARIPEAGSGPQPVGLFLVDSGAPGLTCRSYPTQDGMRAAEIAFDAVTAVALGEGDQSAAIEKVSDEAAAALCAEAVGAMHAAFQLTVDYLKVRRQFGRALSEFQALQHRAVDMHVLVEESRGMALLAAMALEESDPTERRRSIAAAKAWIGRAGRKLGQEAIQLHGGIGMTLEYAVGHYFKRLTVIDFLFGDAGARMAELERLGGLYAVEREAV